MRRLLLLLLLSVAGCELVERVDRQVYRDYHKIRWKTTVAAYVRGETALSPATEPTTPRVCVDSVEPAYAAILDAAETERVVWQSLRDQNELAVLFIAEMLGVLANRNTVSIEMLTPQIDTYFNEQEALRQAWQDARHGIVKAVAALDTEWRTIWPKHDLHFDLLADAELARSAIFPEPNDLRAAALRHYHDNEYSRLALIYLDYMPEQQPNPVSHVPQDCDELATILARLEAALLVRYSMDEAIRCDVARVQELARVDLSRTPWEDIRVPQNRYTGPKVTASIARLKLLKYLDTLLMSSLDVLQHDVELEWRRVWPRHDLTTNIFAFAGLAEAHHLPHDPLVDMTFRE